MPDTTEDLFDLALYNGVGWPWGQAAQFADPRTRLDLEPCGEPISRAISVLVTDFLMDRFLRGAVGLERLSVLLPGAAQRLPFLQGGEAGGFHLPHPDFAVGQRSVILAWETNGHILLLQ